MKLEVRQRREFPVDTTKLGCHVEFAIPLPSMYGIFTYIYHTDKPNVDKYSIHGCYRIDVTR